MCDEQGLQGTDKVAAIDTAHDTVRGSCAPCVRPCHNTAPPNPLTHRPCVSAGIAVFPSPSLTVSVAGGTILSARGVCATAPVARPASSGRLSSAAARPRRRRREKGRAPVSARADEGPKLSEEECGWRGAAERPPAEWEVSGGEDGGRERSRRRHAPDALMAGDPATRRPGDPATRRPGDPATRLNYTLGTLGGACQPPSRHDPGTRPRTPHRGGDIRPNPVQPSRRGHLRFLPLRRVRDTSAPNPHADLPHLYRNCAPGERPHATPCAPHRARPPRGARRTARVRAGRRTCRSMEGPSRTCTHAHHRRGGAPGVLRTTGTSARLRSVNGPMRRRRRWRGLRRRDSDGRLRRRAARRRPACAQPARRRWRGEGGPLHRPRPARCATRVVRLARARGRLKPRMPPVTTPGRRREADWCERGSDRRQNRPSGQWRQGD